MATLAHSLDRDSQFDHAHQDAPDKPLSLRIPMYIGRRDEAGKIKYAHLRATHWNLQVATPDEGRALRDALDLFFRTVANEGIETTTIRLTMRSERAA